MDVEFVGNEVILKLTKAVLVLTRAQFAAACTVGPVEMHGAEFVVRTTLTLGVHEFRAALKRGKAWRRREAMRARVAAQQSHESMEGHRTDAPDVIDQPV